MNKNLKLVINNSNKKIEERYFFERKELKTILDLYAKMVSEGSWKDYGLNISSRQVGFNVFKNAAESANYSICKNFDPLSIWKKYSKNLIGKPINGGHYLPEEKPYQVARQILKFLK